MVTVQFTLIWQNKISSLVLLSLITYVYFAWQKLGTREKNPDLKFHSHLLTTLGHVSVGIWLSFYAVVYRGKKKKSIENLQPSDTIIGITSDMKPSARIN